MSIYNHRKYDGTTNVTDAVSTREKDELTTKINNTIKEHGGKVSDIPHNHEFHSWMNKLRSLIHRDSLK